MQFEPRQINIYISLLEDHNISAIDYHDISTQTSPKSIICIIDKGLIVQYHF